VETFTSWHTAAAAEAGLRERLPPATVDLVADAIAYATAKHGDQRRPTGVPYLEHLLEALQALVEGAGITDPDVLAAAVLHDVLEDTEVTTEQLAQRFGPQIAELVSWVTIPKAGPGEDKAQVKIANFKRLAEAPREAKLIKLADRLSNAQGLRNIKPARQRAYYTQTVDYIMPLAAAEPWFAAWYADWQAAHADLGS